MKNDIVFLILFLSIFCVHESVIAQKVITYNLEKAINKSESTTLAKVANKISYIPLETNSECLIKDIKRVISWDNKIFIFDYHNVFVFSIDGKFEQKFIIEGKGPFEVLQVTDVCINETNRKIYAVDPRLNKILVFDDTYKPILEYTTKFPAKHITPFLDGIAYDNMTIDYISEDALINVVDSKGKSKYLLNHNRDSKFKIGLNYVPIQLYSSNNSLFYKDKWCDTIYKVDQYFNVSPYMALHLGKYKNKPEKDDLSGITGKKNNTFKLDVYDIQEISQFLFVSVNNGFFICNKSNGSVFFQGKDHFGIKNDIDFGPEFYPRFRINDTTMASLISPFELDSFSSEFKSRNMWIKDVKYDDNPILMTVKFNN